MPSGQYRPIPPARAGGRGSGLGSIPADTRLLLHPAFPLPSREANSDGKVIARAGPGGGVTLRDTVTGKELSELEGHGGWVSDLAFGPDGVFYAACLWQPSRK